MAKKYEIFWKHCIKEEPKSITEQTILDIVDKSESRRDIKKKIAELFEPKEYIEKTYSKCTIHKIDINSDKNTIEEGELANGIAILKPGDTFNRKIGMQISFIDAVCSIQDRSVRIDIWKEYLKDHKIIKTSQK